MEPEQGIEMSEHHKGDIARLASPEGALDRLRASISSEDSSAQQLRRINHELRLRCDPERVVPARAFEFPWGRDSRVRKRAAELSLEARLDVFRDDLQAIRIASEVLSRAATMRALEAAEAAIFEIRCSGETTRYAILNQAHLSMTRQFLDQLAAIEAFRGRVSNEVLDALKERALNEFSARMNRASKADVEFSKGDILRLKL